MNKSKIFIIFSSIVLSACFLLTGAMLIGRPQEKISTLTLSNDELVLVLDDMTELCSDLTMKNINLKDSTDLTI